MDNEIRKENKIAGSCDRYTKPEEIAALGKYLRTIKKAYEDSTTLEEDNIGVSGFKDNATMRVIDSLSDRIERISPKTTPVSLSDTVEKLGPGMRDLNLSGVSEKIGNDLNESTLSDNLENLIGSQELVERLSSNIKKDGAADVIPESSGAATGNLRTETVKMENSKSSSIQGLSSAAEKIINPGKQVALDDTSEKLVGKIEPHKLVDSSEKLVGKLEDIGLANKSELILGTTDNKIELSDKYEGLIGNKNDKITKLPDSSINIQEDKKKIELETESEKIVGKSSQVSLVDSKENIVGVVSNHELESGNDKIVGNISEPSLVNTSEGIIGSQINNELETESEKIVGKNLQVSLVDTKEELVGNISESRLETSSEKLVGKISEPSLVNQSEGIIGAQTNNKLETSSEKIVGNISTPDLETKNESLLGKNKEVNLVEGNEELIGNKHDEPGLSTFLDDIVGKEKEPKLETESEKLVGKLDNPDLVDKNEKLVGKITEPVLVGEAEKLRESEVELEDKLVTISEKLAEPISGKKDIKLVDKSVDLVNKRGAEEVITSLSSDLAKLNVSENISLSDYLERLGNVGDVELEDGSEKLIGNTPDNQLEDYLDRIKVDDVPGLSDYRENIDPTDVEKLEDYRENIDPTDVEKLEDFRDDINPSDVSGLSDYRDNISPTDVDKLEDGKILIGGNYSGDVTGLSDSLEQMEPQPSDNNSLYGELGPLGKLREDINPKDADLSDYREDMGGEPKDPALETDLERRLADSPDLKKGQKEFNPGSDSLYDSALSVGEDLADEPFSGELEDGKENIVEVTERKEPELETEREILSVSEISELEDDKEKLTTDRNLESVNNSDSTDLSDIVGSRDRSLDEYYSGILHFADSKDLTGGWAQKIQSLMSAYLSHNPSDREAKEFLTMLYKSVLDDSTVTRVLDNKGSGGELSLGSGKSAVSKMKLPGFSINSLNISNYLRYAAENVVGRNWHKGQKLRALLLDEVLAALVVARESLEKLTKSNRDRLPGDDLGLLSSAISGGASGALKGVGKSLGNAVFSGLTGNGLNMGQPQNRPKKSTTGFTKLNELGADHVVGYKLESGGGSGGFWNKVRLVASSFAKSMISSSSGKENFSFTDNYVKNAKGVGITIDELTNKSVGDISSVEDLFSALRTSNNITTSDNYVSSDSGHKISTIDSNNYWEVILKPYVEGGVNGNGGFSFLPPIEEINVWNKVYHGYNTSYSAYIPLTGFELQKSKLNSKTLALYEGEISYPTSMEFSNEFRLSIADDQFKSWRNYFERCADVSVYSSRPHKQDDYKEGLKYNDITAIDKTYTCIAPYKNITFRCLIYCMTPQYSTINKYDLLLVMKDFSEDRIGDIESGGGDLTVSFSIVGENPGNEFVRDKTPISLEKPGNLLRNDKASNLASIVSGGVNSVIGLL